jgi:glutathione S-transferase
VPKIEFMLDYLNGELAEREFIAGDNFTVADIDALCAIDFMRVARVQMKEEHANLKRWHEQVSARPSAGA